MQTPERGSDPHRPADHPPVSVGRVGVLLINLGSPEAPTAAAVRPWLRQFLSDPRVVELPRAIWLPVLHGFVLLSRPARTAEAYAAIWDREADDSPLRVITRAQAEALAARLGPEVHVDFAMRYGAPAIAERLRAMREAGCDRILVAPLYPQYSSATTGTALEELFRQLAGERWMPALRTLPPYFDHPAHIAALARLVGDQLAALPFVPERLVMSFHGMPVSTLLKGDPYHCQCRKTARLLGEALGMADRVEVTFQSRFGPAEWLQPYTEPRLLELAAAGVRRVAVTCPGFSADCLETLEEIAIEARAAFLAAGGTDYAYLPCLNATETGMEMLEVLVRQELSGWLQLEGVTGAV
ncbi:ferrochelatase [Thermaurantiacus tibetensis]|uniref:ferrochelatase n=1 Tax=Thermaurantiacus tibetensis TaxID=2759035 RepID=UPI00188E769A|nr:ferrochelatase [Thermaurantiacus tibetensis]